MLLSAASLFLSASLLAVAEAASLTLGDCRLEADVAGSTIHSSCALHTPGEPPASSSSSTGHSISSSSAHLGWLQELLPPSSCLEFSGGARDEGSYARNLTHDIGFSNGLSVAFWLRWRSMCDACHEGAFWISDTGGTRFLFLDFRRDYNCLQINTETKSNNKKASDLDTACPAITDGSFHHFVVTRNADGSNVAVFLDGTQLLMTQNDGYGGWAVGAGDLIVGGLLDNANVYTLSDMAIADFRVYTAQLTAAQAVAIMAGDGSADVARGALALRLRLEDGPNATALVDSSGHERSLQLLGPPATWLARPGRPLPPGWPMPPYTTLFAFTPSSPIRQVIDGALLTRRVLRLRATTRAGTSAEMAMVDGMSILQQVIDSAWVGPYPGHGETDEYKFFSGESADGIPIVAYNDHDIALYGDACSPEPSGCSGHQDSFSGTPYGLLRYSQPTPGNQVDYGMCCANSPPSSWSATAQAHMMSIIVKLEARLA